MRLRPSERLTALVLVVLTGLALVVRPPGWGLRVLAFAALLAGQGAAARAPRKGLPGLVRDFAPVAVVLAVFLLLQPLVAAANPHRYDAALAGFDARWLGGLADRWRNAFGRPGPFTDAVYAAYASFYLLPLGVAVLARLRLGAAGLERVAFTLLLGFYLSFLGYFLWPAEGPRIPAALESARLGGGPASEAIRAFLRSAESTTLDAFPSGHTALSLLPVLLATRPFPRLAPLLWAWAIAVIFATVYISAHYIVDLLAGAALVPLTLLLARPMARWLGSGPLEGGPGSGVSRPGAPPT